MPNYSASLKVTELLPFTLAPKDSLGNTAALDANTLTFTVSDPSVLMVSPWGDGVHQKVTPLQAGSALVTIAAKSNNVPLSEQISVTVQPTVAVTFGVTIKDPLPK